MKRIPLILTAAVFGLSALAATATLAHGPESGYGQGMGQGQHMMQGRGYGHGFGAGQQDCLASQALDKPLTIEDVRANLQARLERQGNDRLKVGEVIETNDKTITAEIVTVDNSLVRKIEIDKSTGRHTPVR